jgi:hypothetical protein
MVKYTPNSLKIQQLKTTTTNYIGNIPKQESLNVANLNNHY